ncbi:hypothetical protein E6O75_ATG10295 [Venturia nashicola]|uniref:Uncharacterized protein n=1 Tax=Venturia nashicola TaxID=86259 RepID=A0A4Z1NZQ1_9PEZI|nr:hypothetical protein E6O75_ATG10295 [Venturia nashicola]
MPFSMETFSTFLIPTDLPSTINTWDNETPSSTHRLDNLELQAPIGQCSYCRHLLANVHKICLGRMGIAIDLCLGSKDMILQADVRNRAPPRSGTASLDPGPNLGQILIRRIWSDADAENDRPEWLLVK